MFKLLENTIESIETMIVSDERKEVLRPLIEYIQFKVNSNQKIRLNFICTHNSRRSHLGQIWAQTMAFKFKIQNVYCYSGGTEVTALFPKVAETLTIHGFKLSLSVGGENPIYSVKFSENELPLVCFSKTYDDLFNPQSEFAAIITCSSADENCPYIPGTEKRIAIRYDDPKEFDGTDRMDEKYAERSLEIASEMYYVFSKIQL